MNYIFFIGGSGARAYTAFLHACAAGVIRVDQACVMLLDADAQNAACDNSIKLFQTYQLHRQMLQRVQPSSTVFRCDIQMLQESAISPVQDDTSNLAQVAGGNDTRKRALKWFYTQKELYQDLSKGFYAHPNIGCVFFQNFNSNPYLDRCMKQIISDLKNGLETRVVIVGSVFGGTGAAGIPSIVKILKDRCAETQLSFSRLRCCGVLITPYFKVAQAPDSNELTINSDSFYGITKAALPYYRFMDNFEKTYLVGQTTLETVNEQYTDGGKDQNNKPHIVEIFSALAIKDFLDDTLGEKQCLGQFVDRNNINEQIDWEFLGEDMYSLADMARAQMVLETAIYPCSVNRLDRGGGYQWRWVYHADSPISQQQLALMQKYGESFFEWLYHLQRQYIGASGNMCTDSKIKLYNPEILDRLWNRVEVRKNPESGLGNPEYDARGGWRKYQKDFINLIETAEKIEYVVKKIGVLLSALGVLHKPTATLNCAGLFLKLFSLSEHTPIQKPQADT